MENGKNYTVVLTTANGEVIAIDNRSFKTLDGALSRLSDLVASEELCLQQGCGVEHEYHIQVR